MAAKAHFLAFDLGAESGRALLGALDGSSLQLTEIHRFPNGPVRILDSLHWDVLRLFEEIKVALGKAAQYDLAGIGLDTWGVDWALLDASGSLVGTPYHYRDRRTEGMMARVLERVPRQEIFQRTGIQFMEINTLYQLYAMSLRQPQLLAAAQTFLMMPDLFNYWLTGQKVCEFTEATTSQFYDPRAGDWARELLQRLSLPHEILAPVVPPGTVLGPLLAGVREQVGLGAVPVIAPACHDTGSAVVAVPAQGSDFVYISSGTWALQGIEVRAPVITEATLQHNFTNEGGAGGTFRLLKNIVGLWLVQECRREWARQGREMSYDELTRLAAEAEPFRSLVNPDHPTFMPPGGMPERIQGYCRESGQPIPETPGQIVRAALESLALRFRAALEQLESIARRGLSPIHIVGGGSQNNLLNQFTADATGRPVIAGPVEATAMGNVIVQAVARGYIGSVREGRELVRRATDVREYEPGDTARWDQAYERFLRLPG
ncbi:MAG: rhamnulokinase family protein [Anaerolineae bacterium]|nr:rhamnulokinase family protein [Anaerolineae bacterium]